jgi:hypothetical protein
LRTPPGGLWDTGDDFNRFVDSRLMPAVQEIGIEGRPNVEIHEAHAIFAPLGK